MLDRIAPFLNKAIGASLAVAGISKINPNLGKFISSSLIGGYSADEVMDFLRSKIENTSGQATKQRLKSGLQNDTLRPDEKAAYERIRQSESIPNAAQTIGTLGLGALGGTAGLAIAGANELATGEDPGPKDPFHLLSGYSSELSEFIKKQIQNGRSPKEAAAIAKTNTPFGKIVKKIENDTKKNFVDLLEEMFAGQSFQQAQPSQSQSAQLSQQGAPQQNGDAALISAFQKILNM